MEIDRVKKIRAGTIGVLGFTFLATFVSPAHAYLDPGSGSMLLQLLLGGAAGALIIGKLYWAKLKTLFSGTSTTNRESDTIPSDTSDDER